MYHPRRTSEFHEDARDDGGILNKRQTRSQRSTSAASNKTSQLLHSSWQAQARLTQDRDRGTPLRNGLPPPTKRSLANGGRNSTTPLRHRQATSVERPVALHTDKKWVQEQSQLIAEYLDEMNQTAVLPGFASEFFSRGGTALRQMTMKQFVGIVNFFFQFIWGSRISVGSNHVEDITNALHKINYPYQVNKSWLMTPTTQHSFGHVIVLFDFLKDFAPISPAKQQQDEEFPFVETSEQPTLVQNTLDSMALSNTQVSNSVLLNEETIQLLFTTTADCFAMWDKQKGDENAVFKREVSNQIIKSLCDLPDTESLDADIVRLRNELQHLDKQLNLPCSNNLKHLQQLIAQDQQLEEQLISTQTRTKEHKEKIEHLCRRSEQHTKRIGVLRKELQKLQHEISKQNYTADELQSLKDTLSDLENEEQFYKRQMRDFTERGNNQQVLLSRAKKHLLDHVEKFNKHAQDIGCDSDICSASEKDKLELVLPLPPLPSDIQSRSRRLTKLATLLEQRGAQHDERHRQLEQLGNELSLQNLNLEGELKKITKQIQLYEQQMVQLHHTHKSKRSNWAQRQQQLDERSFEFNATIEQLKQQQQDLSDLLANKREQNENFLSAAEREQEERLRIRRALLERCLQKFAHADEQINQIHAIIAQNDAKLANFQQEQEQASVKQPSLEEIFTEFRSNKQLNNT